MFFLFHFLIIVTYVEIQKDAENIMNCMQFQRKWKQTVEISKAYNGEKGFGKFATHSTEGRGTEENNA